MRKLCAVYGGSRGIGRAIAHTFYHHGYDVALLSRNKAVLEIAVVEIRRSKRYDDEPLKEQNSFVVSAEEKHKIISDNARQGEGSSNKIEVIACDVADENDVQQSVHTILSVFNQPAVSVLVNCAGVLHPNLLLKTSGDQIRQQLNTNLLGTIYTCKAHLKHMMRQRGGAIISIGSVTGAVGWPGQAAYAASKEGLVGFTRNLAVEVASRGITVNVVAPGFTQTDMTSSLKLASDLVSSIPLQRMATVEEVARTVYFVAECGYMTGQTIYLDGGLTA